MQWWQRQDKKAQTVIAKDPDVQRRVEQLIASCQDPWLGSDWVSAGCVQSLDIDANRIGMDVLLPYPCKESVAVYTDQLQQLLQTHGFSSRIQVRSHIAQAIIRTGQTAVPEVKNIIAVASGKGGVGKSTTAMNLAYALQREGAMVGILDADIYGPSLALLSGLASGTHPQMTADQKMLPLQHHGLQLMSLAFLSNETTPVIWRGPMATGALLQMLTLTAWQALDYLIIDMPPGTGDIALTLAQKVPVTAALVVTTPQDLARIDAAKAIEMFSKVSIPVLGLVENMAVHVCSQCGHQEHIFGEGAGDRLSLEYHVPVLAHLPLDSRIRRAADQGEAWMQSEHNASLAAIYQELALRSAVHLASLASKTTPDPGAEGRIPTLTL